MRLAITGDEWQTVLARVRDVGGALGGLPGEGAAIVVARAALEALGIAVPVVVDELDEPRTVSTDPAAPVADERTPPPPRDLRVSARTLAAVDGFCPHCDTVIPAAQLAAGAGGSRLCPTHGSPVRDLVEVAEGRFEISRLPGDPVTATVGDPDAARLCGAPIGGDACRLNPGHDGRHSPLRAEPVRGTAARLARSTAELTADDHAPYPHEDHPGGHE